MQKQQKKKKMKEKKTPYTGDEFIKDYNKYHENHLSK